METPTGIVVTASNLLKPYFPQITPKKLLKYLNGQNDIESDQYITRDEVCRRLHVTLPTVDKLIKKGKLKATKVTEGKVGIVRISVKSLSDMMNGKI